MEGNYLTSGDLALMESRRYYGGGDYYGHGHGKGMAATGIGLAAGLGGGALIGVLALAYGLNNASKARQKAAENACAGTAKAIDILANMAVCERNSRESWQNANSPSIRNYVDIQSGALAGATSVSQSSALAQAEANLLSGALTGQFARCPQEVTLVSKRNCGCPVSDCGCNG